MSFDPKLWEAFGEYAWEAYRHSPRFSKSITAWHADLAERSRQGADIELAFFEAQHALNGTMVRGYSINGQMLCSKNPDVLALPYPRSAHGPVKAVHSDRLIGNYFHDFAINEDLFTRLTTDVASGFEKEQARFEGDKRHYDACDPKYSADLKPITDHLTEQMAQPHLPGGDTNKLTEWQLRLARFKPKNDMRHHDCRVRSESRFGPNVETWSRVLIMPLTGNATQFVLNKNGLSDKSLDETSCTVPSALGAVTSALAFQAIQYWHIDKDQWGAFHFAKGDQNGRAVLIKVDNEKSNDWAPVDGGRTPWRVQLYSADPR